MVFLYLCKNLLCWMVGLSDCKPFPGHITLVLSVWLIGFLVWSVFALKIVRRVVVDRCALLSWEEIIE
jgi:hypothetical protein